MGQERPDALATSSKELLENTQGLHDQTAGDVMCWDGDLSGWGFVFVFFSGINSLDKRSKVRSPQMTLQ